MTFDELFGRPFTSTARAPGRVNLIGEHTDYNAGFVLPTPIPQMTRVELAPAIDETARDLVRAWSDNAPGGGITYRLGDERRQEAWIDYVQGVTQALRAEGHVVRGFDLRIASDVPMGSGLSSSAALEIALLRALREAFALPLTDTDLARVGQRAENELVGAPVGIMDQMVCSLGQAGQALFLDTETLSYQVVALPESVSLIVIDSQVRHAHATGDYRRRRDECERACRALGVERLRDVDAIALDLAETLEALPTPLGRRARHVVTENRRVLQMVDALRHERLDECGRLLYEGHVSLRDDYEVSTPELDRLVELAMAQPRVYGARLTGGGFGGSIVALAEAGAGTAAARAIAAAYQHETGTPVTVLVP